MNGNITTRPLDREGERSRTPERGGEGKGKRARARESSKLYSKPVSVNGSVAMRPRACDLTLIVSEPRADPLTCPGPRPLYWISVTTARNIIYIREEQESKFSARSSSFFLSPPKSHSWCPLLPPRRGIIARRSPGRAPRERRKRDETSETAKCTSLRHVRFNCILGPLTDSIERGVPLLLLPFLSSGF